MSNELVKGIQREDTLGSSRCIEKRAHLCERGIEKRAHLCERGVLSYTSAKPVCLSCPCSAKEARPDFLQSPQELV